MSSRLKSLFNGIIRPTKAVTSGATTLPAKILTLQPRPHKGFLLYEKTAYPWWIKWMYGLLGMNIFMTASSMDLTWNHWTERTTEKPEYTPEDDTGDRYVLRSTYQRFSLASLVFIAGCTGCATALFMRSQYVMSFGLLPKSMPRGEPSIFVQTYQTGGDRGFRIPIRHCKLLPGRDTKESKELVVKVEGRKYPWYLPLDNKVIINGEKVTPMQAQQTIIRSWGTKYISEKLTNPFTTEKKIGYKGKMSSSKQ